MNIYGTNINVNKSFFKLIFEKKQNFGKARKTFIYIL